MRKHLLAIAIAVGAALFILGLSDLKVDFKGDVLSRWNPTDQLTMAAGALIAIWAFIEYQLN
jgi:hypothetical protein